MNLKPWLWLYGILFLLGAGSVPQAGATATVMGKIRDGSGNFGTPLANAWVFVDSAANSALTNALGAYLLKDITLHASPHSFLVTKTDYALYQLTDAPIVDGQTNTLNAALYRGCLISGQITLAGTTTPLAGVTVSAVNKDLTSFYSTVSQADGAYFQRQPPGPCFLWADHPDYAPSPYSVFVDLKDKTSEKLDFQLFAGGTISGRVTYEENGLPVAYAPVSATASWTVSDRPRCLTFTAADGTYTLAHVYPDDTDVVVQAPPGFTDGRRSLVVKDERIYNNFNFALRGAGALQGRVSHYLGSGVEGAQVILAPASGNSLNQRSTLTLATGDYSLTGLLAGEYFLQIKPPQGSNLQIAQSGGIVIVPGTPVVHNFTLQPGGTVQGTVRFSGAPVAGARVQVYLDLLYPFSELLTRQTDDTGNYIVDGLSPYQSYTVSVVPAGNTLTPQAARIQQGITVAETQVLALDFNLLDGGGRIGAAQPPVPGQAVVFNSDLGLGVALDSITGEYELSSLPEGDYAFVLFPSAGDSAPQTNYIHVSPGAVEVQDILLPPGGAIEGVVADALSGSPVADAKVVARNRFETLASVPGFEHKAFTDETGYYKIRGLAAGTYQVECQPPVASGLCAQAASVAVVAGQTQVQPVNLASGGVKVHGTARDPFGNRIIGGLACFTSPGLHVEAATDAWGNYAVNLPAGTYQAQVAYTSLLGVNVAMEPVTCAVSVGMTALQTDFVMQTGGRLSGRVTTPLGASLPLAMVRVFQENAFEPVRSALTGQDGSFVVAGLHSGAYTVSASAVGYSASQTSATVLLGSQTSGLTLVLVPASSIAGTVRGQDQQPLSGAVLQRLDPVTRQLAGQTVTNAMGEYALPGVSGGGWSVKASATGRQSQTLTQLAAGDRADFVLNPLIGKSEAISYPNPSRNGRVTFLYWLDQDATVLIRAYNVTGELVWDWTGPGTGGRYNQHEWNVEGVAPGVYLFKITAHNEAGYSVSFPAGKLTVLR